MSATGAPAPPGGGGRPALPYGLGLSGLLPFWALALAHVTGLPHGVAPGIVSAALATYAATIVSFLGGIRWGVAVREADQRRVARDYVVGVLPQLIAWAALAVPDPWRFGLLGIVVLALGPLDRDLSGRGLAPPWFGRLRALLSLGAGTALFLAALA